MSKRRSRTILAAHSNAFNGVTVASFQFPTVEHQLKKRVGATVVAALLFQERWRIVLRLIGKRAGELCTLLTQSLRAQHSFTVTFYRLQLRTT